MISRPLFLATALAAAATRPAFSQAMPSLRCASAPDDDVSPFLYARDSGLFKKNGVDAVLTRANSGAAVAAAVTGGSVDIGKSSLISLITAHQKGLPIVLVAPSSVYDAARPDVAMVVAKESTIEKPRDLVGKTIAVSALGDLYAIANDAFIDASGVSYKDVKYLELPSASAPEALANHRIDAVTFATPTLQIAIASGKVRVLGHPFDDIAKRFLRAAWFTTRDFAAKNADAVARFRRSLEQASAYTNAHPADTVAALAAFSGMDANVIAHMPRAISGTALDPKLLQPTIDAAFKYGAISARFDAAEMIAPGAT